jgi:hypothetical protein
VAFRLETATEPSAEPYTELLIRERAELSNFPHIDQPVSVRSIQILNLPTEPDRTVAEPRPNFAVHCIGWPYCKEDSLSFDAATNTHLEIPS